MSEYLSTDPNAGIGDYLSTDPNAGVQEVDEEQRRRKDVPKMSVGSVAQDVVSGALQIGPTAAKGALDIARLATGDRIGKDWSESMQRGITSIQDVFGSDRAKAQRQNFEADVADESVNAWDTIKNNKGALADMFLPTVGSMFLPVGVASATGKVATMGKTAAAMNKAALTARVAKVQQVSGVSTIAAQNAAQTFVDMLDAGETMPDAYLAAGITVPFSVVAGVLTGGGAEGAINRAMTRTGAFKTGVGEVLKAGGREGAQEVGEELGQITGKAVATEEMPTLNSVGKQLSVAGTLGAVMGGGVDVARQAGGFGKPQAHAGQAVPQPAPAGTPPVQPQPMQPTDTSPADALDAADLVADEAVQQPPAWTAPAQPTTMQAPSMDTPASIVPTNHLGTPLSMGDPVSIIPTAIIAQRRDEAATPEDRKAIELEMQRRGLPGATDGATDQGGQISPLAAQGAEGASADVPGSGGNPQAGVPGGLAGGSGSAGVSGSANGQPVSAGDAGAFDVSGMTDEQLANLVKGGKPGWREAAIAEVARRSETKPDTPLQESATPSVTQAVPASLPVESAAPGTPVSRALLHTRDFLAKFKGSSKADRVAQEKFTAAAEKQFGISSIAGYKGGFTVQVADREDGNATVYLQGPSGAFLEAGTVPLTDTQVYQPTGEQIAPQPEPLAQKESQAQGTEGKTEGVAPSLADIQSGRATVDRVNGKIGEWVNHATNNGARQMDRNWESKAVKRFIDAEIAPMMAGKQYGNRAAAKIAVGKAVTFDDLRAAIAKYADTPVQVTPPADTKTDEVITFDQRFQNIAEAEKVIKERGLKQVAVFKDGDQYRIGVKGATSKAASKNLIARIKQLGGINTRYRNDVIRDKSGAPGLFSNSGKGLDDLATELKADGFDIDTDTVDGGVEILTDLIQRAVMGETILNFEGQELSAQKRQNDEYRDNLKEEIEKLGGNPVKNASTKKLVDMLEGLREKLRTEVEQESIANAAQLEAIIGKELTDTEWDMLLDERNAVAFDYTQDIEAISQREQEREAANAVEREYEREGAQVAGQRAGEGSRQGDSTRGGEPQAAPTEEGREALVLTGETPADVKAKEEAQAAKAKAEQDAADKADAEARKKRIDAEVASRQQASAENFVLGQDAEDALAGQGDIFSQPALAPKKPEVSEPINLGGGSEFTPGNKINVVDGKWVPGAAPVAKQDKIEDFGEKLPTARRAMAAKLNEDLTDEVIESQPLSKIWPLKENEAIEDTFAAAVASVMRENIPAKPRKGYKLNSWVAKVKMLRNLAAKVVDGRVSKDRFNAELDKYSSLKSLASKIKLLEQIDRDQWGRIGDVTEAPDALRYVDGNPVRVPQAFVKIDGKQNWLQDSGDINDHIDAINALLAGDAPDVRMQFEIRQERSGNRKVFINKKGDKEYRRLMEFDTVEAARKAMKDQYDDLVAAWDGVKGRDNINERDLRSEENRPRAGKDHRKGKDISAEEFQETFGFVGGEFGKWVSQGKNAQERQFFVNSAYDAFMDLADILGIPPKAVSLEGTLGIAFGSRGSGWASAHFEPSNLVINLTKPRGAGALAHEWFHAMDNYFARKRGGEVAFAGDNNAYRDDNYVTHKTTPMMVRKDGKGSPVTKERLAAWRKSNPTSGYLTESEWIPDPNHKEGVRAEVEERFENLVNVLNESPMLNRSKKLERSGNYWSRTLELAARSFENYIMTRMMEQGYHNDFLANVKDAESVGKNNDRYPYLLPEEIAPVAGAFDALFNTIQTKETDKGVAMFEPATVYTVNEDGPTYDTDLFGNPLPNRDRKRDKAADRGVIRAATSISSEPGAIPGTYQVRTALVTEQDRTIGVNLVITPEDAARALGYLSNKAVEHFDALVTDKNGKPLAIVGAFKGTISQTSVYPQTLVSEAIRIPGAANIWMAHNHPSGTHEPSMADRNLTEQVKQVFSGTGIEVVESLVIAGPTDRRVASGIMNGMSGVPVKKPDASVKVPVVELSITEDQEGRTAINSPQAAKSVFYANSESGVMLLDSQNKMAGFYPIKNWDSLLTDGRLAELYRAMSMANASAAMVFDKTGLLADKIRNVANALARVDVRMLDVLQGTQGNVTSWAETGKTINDGAPVFSRNTAPADIALRDLKAVTARVKRNLANLPTVNVLSSPEQLDRADASQAALYDFIEQAGAMNDVEGATHDGEIYLFASGLADEARAEYVLATHEATHYGLRAMFGMDLDPVLQSIWATNANIRKQATELRKSLGLKSNVAAVEEVLADMSPADLVKLKGWRKLAQFMRDWFQNHGFTVLAGKLDGMLKAGMTEQQQADLLVADVVNAARGWVKGGKRDGKAGSGTMLQRVRHGGTITLYRSGGDKGRYGMTFYSTSEDYAWNFNGGNVEAIEVDPGRVLDLTEYGAEEGVSADDLSARLDEFGVNYPAEMLHHGNESADDAEILQHISQGRDPAALVVAVKAAGYDSIKINEYVEGSGSAQTYAMLERNGEKLDAMREADARLYRQGDTITVDGVERSRLNSNGKPIAQTDEALTNFWRWFADSAVVDAEEMPLILYHGTGVDSWTVANRPVYMTSDAGAAAKYGDNVMQLYASIKNPFVLEQDSGGEEFYDILEKYEIKAYDNIFEQLSTKKVINAFTEEGYDGFFIDGDSPDFGETFHYTWVAFRPDQIKSATGNSGQFDGSNADIRLSRANQSTLPGVQQSPPVQPPSQQSANLQGGASGNQSVFNTPEPSKMDDIIFKLQDSKIDLKRAIQGITDAGRQIADKWNTYMQEELFHGRTAKRVQDFADRELSPVLREMALRKVSIADLDKYLWARHAKEANALIERRDPGVMVDDVTGQPKGSGMTDQEADDYFAGLSTDQRNQLDAIARQVDRMISKTRDLYVSYGLENRDTVQGWADMFQHYVPLMREDHDGGMGIGQGFSIKGREAKHRTGSTRAVADVLANIATQREKAIVRGEKNRVAVSLAGLVKLNPAPGFWTLDKIPQERVLNEKTGLVETREAPNYRTRDNVIIAKIKDSNGNVKERAIVLNENDERAVRLAKSMKNIDIPILEGWLGSAAVVTRYFSAINTQYNPVFGVVNLIRDVGAGALNLSSTALKGKEAIVTNPKRIASAVAGIYSDARKERKGQTGTSPWAQLWEDFTEQGGQTGYRDMFKTSNDRADAMQSVMDPTSWTESKWGQFFTANGTLKAPLLAVQKAATPLFNWLSDYNLAMENAVRLSAYKEALDSGMSKPQAASLAKNLTVNFNRKGAWGAQAGALYAFFNAATQGSARIGETLTRRDHATGKYSVSGIGKKIIGGGVMLGVMQAVALAMAGFDDDEPPEFIRERSIVIPLMDGKYISIPMPLGFHVIPNIGRIATETLMGRRGSATEAAIDLIGITFDAFNPIGSAGWSMQTVVPTILDPMAAIIENKDWTGKPIAKEKFSNNDPTPGFDMAKDNASAISTAIAYAINMATGGTDYTAGRVSPTPDQLDYLWGQVTGGVGREGNKLYQSIESMFTGEELPPHKIPLAGRLYGNTQSKSAISARFYENVRDMKKHKAEYIGRMEDGDSDGAQAYLEANPDAAMIGIVTAYERKIQKLRSLKRKTDDPEDVKAIEEMTSELMSQFNQQMESAKQQVVGEPAQRP